MSLEQQPKEFAMVARINNLEPEFKRLADDQLGAKTFEFKERLSKGESLDDLLPEAFAAVREAAVRKVNLRPYDVQLLGGIALHRGQIAEMKTGEGKTLTAVLALYLNALGGNGAHLVTANDYLARRDAQWMGPIFAALGMTVGILQSGDEKSEVERNTAYQADIVYGTNSEFGFDYLRDNMVRRSKDRVQRGHSFAIIDEIDHVLIDQARTPLIISESLPEWKVEEKRYDLMRRVVAELDFSHCEVDKKYRTVTLTERGINRLKKLLNMGASDLYDDDRRAHHLELALEARFLYEKNKDYVVSDGKVIIVSPHTGRGMPGRRWPDGLHQAVEAKEGVEIQPETKVHAVISLQNYFRKYEKLAGMTATALPAEEEFEKVYGLRVVPIPTNINGERKIHPDRVFRDRPGKLKGIVVEILARHATGQPLLIGNAEIDEAEELSEMLTQEGVLNNLLTAKNDAEDAKIIANAGVRGAVTVATNIVGRGVDIKLGGENATERERALVVRLGGLCVIGVQRQESRRTDDQLGGRAARQGDPGEEQFFLSLEDELMKLHLSGKVRARLEKVLENTGELSSDWIQALAGIVTGVQKKVEGVYFDIRKHLLEYDDILSRQREVVYKQRERAIEKSDLSGELIRLIEEELGLRIDLAASDHDSARKLALWLRRIDPGDPFPDKLLLGALTQKRKEGGELKKKIFSHLRLKLENLPYKMGESWLGKNVGKELSEELRLEAIKRVGSWLVTERMRTAILIAIDEKWTHHLTEIEALKVTIGLEVYGVSDPLPAFKSRVSDMFVKMMQGVRRDSVDIFFFGQIGSV